MKKRALSLILTLCMLLSLLPAAALAAEGDAVTLNISSGSIVITDTGYSVSGGAETAHTGAYILTGSSGSNTVTVASGSHAITMQGLSVSLNGSGRVSPFTVQSGAEAIVTLLGENTLTITSSNYEWSSAALRVPAGATLTVTAESTGSLTVEGKFTAAGIGGSTGEDAGTVNIHGGTVNASGGVGAGIGGGAGHGDLLPGSGGHIVITGGRVMASSTTNNHGAGIGGGGSHDTTVPAGGSAGLVEISGGYVHATGNPGIGCGNYATEGGTISVTGGLVTARGTYEGAPIGPGTGSSAAIETAFHNCIIIAMSDEQTGQGTVYGNATLEFDYDLPTKTTLTIPVGATLTVPEGVTLNSFGTLQNNGVLTGAGTVYGTVTGNAPSATLTHIEAIPVVNVSSEAELRAAMEHEVWNIKLTADLQLSDRLELTGKGTLDGGGHAITLTGADENDCMEVQYGGCVDLSNLTITSGNGAQDYLLSNSRGTVTMENCLITDSGHIGVYNNGEMTLTDCTISNNTGRGVCGYTATSLIGCLVIGNKNSMWGPLYLHNSIVTGNVDGGLYPGGLYARDQTFIANSVMLGNHSLQDTSMPSYDLRCDDGARAVVTDSVVGGCKAWAGTGMAPHTPELMLDSQVNEDVALDTVFANLTKATVNGKEIDVPVIDDTKRGVAAVELTEEWAAKLAAKPKALFWVEGYNGPFDYDHGGPGGVGLTVFSSLPYTAYFSDEELTAENYLEKGRTDQHAVALWGVGSKTIYYYILRRGYPDVAGSAEVVVTKGEQPPIDVSGIVFNAENMTLGKVHPNFEYSVDGGFIWIGCGEKWGADIPVSNVTARQDILLRYAESANFSASPADVVIVEQQEKPTGVTATQPGAVGDAGTISGVTAAMEYSADNGGSWTAGNGSDITGVAQGATYLVRTKAAGNALASAPVAVTIFAYNAVSAETPTAAVDFEHETLTDLSGDVLVDGTPYTVTGALPIEESWLGKRISIVRRGDGTTTKDSAAQELPIAARPRTPAVTSTDETYPGAADGTLGTDSTMEYRLDGATDWTPCDGETSGLAAGTYFVRLKATAGAFSGDSARVTIGSDPTRQESTPAATVSADNSTLENLIPNAVYSINSIDYTADENGTIPMSGAWHGMTLQIVKKGDGAATTDSEAQYLTTAATYTIDSAEDLRAFADAVNGGLTDTHGVLTADIDLGGSEDDPWTPIGNSVNPFAGVFDGQGHTVSGLYIVGGGDFHGLFGCSAGTIRNVTVAGQVGLWSRIGGICGSNSGLIENCVNQCAVRLENPYAFYCGGICGENTGTIRNCVNQGAVTSAGGASGGYVGCGGVCGYNAGGRVENCYNTGTVTGTGDFEVSGGVCGVNASGAAVTNCFSTGAVTGKGSLAGVCAAADGGTVTNCYYDSEKCAAGDLNSGVTGKPTAAFASGEVAKLLQGDDVDSPWGQAIGADALPALLPTMPEAEREQSKTIYTVTFMTGTTQYAKAYANPGGTVELPDSPAKEGYDFANWAGAEGAAFTSGTPVNADMTVSAVWTEKSKIVEITPDATVALPDGGTVTGNADGTVTVTDTHGTATTITQSADDEKVTVNTETGEITVPGGSTIQAGDATIITEGTGVVQPGGTITFPDGGKVTITDSEGHTTEVTVPAGETVDPADPPHVHSWAEVWSTSDTHHWHDCTTEGCDVTDNSGKHEYGEHAKIWVAADETQHWQTCATCGWESAKAAHTWDKGEITTPATCTEKGVATYTCATCSATKTGEIPAAGHTEEIIPGKAATCAESGLTEGKKCSVCNEVLAAQEEIPATGAHTYNGYQNNEAEHWQVCSVCHTQTAKTAHVYDNDQDAICNVCDYERTVTPPAPTVYTVTFDTQCVIEVAAQSVTEGERAAKPADPTRSGYTFGGWYKEADCTAPWSFETDVVTADVTLYAKWTALPSGGSSSGGSASRGPSVSDGEGGSATAGRDGSVTITPDEGYQIAKITVNGKEVEIPTDGKLTGVKRTDKVVVTFEPIPAPATPVSERFTDVTAGAWYENAVSYVVEKDLFNGTSATTFSPNMAMNRGMLATVLYRLENEPETAAGNLFGDVADDQYYTQGIAWAADKGIVTGYGNGNFGPDDPITREQLAAMLYRYAGEPETGGTLDSFTDAGKASGYAGAALRWAVETGILTGKTGGILDPQGQATRAEVATMLQRYLQLDK